MSTMHTQLKDRLRSKVEQVDSLGHVNILPNMPGPSRHYHRRYFAFGTVYFADEESVDRKYLKNLRNSC